MSELHVGFTGTRRGLSEYQRGALRALLDDLRERAPDNSQYVLHHGDCVGADYEAHMIAYEADWAVMLHPGEDDSGESPYRAHAADERPDHVLSVMEPEPYPVRNMNIVMMTPLLIGCPGGPPRRRSGTWSTVRAAQRLAHPVFVIPPEHADFEKWNRDDLRLPGAGEE